MKKIKYIYWYIKSWIEYPRLVKSIKNMYIKTNFVSRRYYAKERAKLGKLTCEKVLDYCADVFECDVDWRSIYQQEPITK